MEGSQRQNKEERQGCQVNQITGCRGKIERTEDSCSGFQRYFQLSPEPLAERTAEESLP